MSAEKGWAPLWERVPKEHLKAALQDIEEGIPKVTAFVALGYSRSAFHRAQVAGREAEARDDAGEALDRREAGALAFWRQLETAFAKAEKMLIRSIRRAGAGGARRFTAPDGTLVESLPRQWQADKWLLMSTRPEYRGVEESTAKAPEAATTEAEREADLRAYAAARGLRLVPESEVNEGYDPATATKART